MPATLTGGLRGLTPSRPVAPGECVMQLPGTGLITYQTALQSDLVSRTWPMGRVGQGRGSTQPSACA